MRLRIRDLREDNDYTQQEIADLLHVSQKTYSKYELRGCGNSHWSIEKVSEILWHKRGLSAWFNGRKKSVYDLKKQKGPVPEVY